MRISQILPSCQVRAYWGDRTEGVVCGIRRVTAKQLGLEDLWSETGLAVGEHLIVESGSEGTLRRIPMVVTAREWGERPTIMVEICGEVTEVQRRRHGRMRTALPVSLEGAWGPPLRLFTVDVNSEGFRVISPRRLARGTTVAVELELDEDGVFRSLGRVVRSVHMGDEYDLGVQFAGLADEERTRLVESLVRRSLVCETT